MLQKSPLKLFKKYIYLWNISHNKILVSYKNKICCSTKKFDLQTYIKTENRYIWWMNQPIIGLWNYTIALINSIFSIWNSENKCLFSFIIKIVNKLHLHRHKEALDLWSITAGIIHNSKITIGTKHDHLVGTCECISLVMVLPLKSHVQFCICMFPFVYVSFESNDACFTI